MAGMRLTTSWAAALLALAAGMAAPASGSASQLLLFGAEELRSDDITFFPQWTSALDRQAADPQVWSAAFGALRDYGDRDRIAVVNRVVNRVRYVEDIDNWRMADHWSTPSEFFARGGDCEDFAIAKYMALRQLGFAAENLRVVVLQDERSNREHAVLAVYTGDDILILDNLNDDPVPAGLIDYYRPFYSINELGWWLH